MFRLSLVALICLSGCATGPIRKVKFENSIDQHKASAGCYAYEPDSGQLTLITFDTCALVIDELNGQRLQPSAAK